MNLVPPEREQGMPGACCTRGLVCKGRRKAHTSIQVQPEHSGIPCAMALRLMPRSPWRRIRLASITADLMAQSIRSDRIRHRQLGTSNGCRDHTVLPYASAPYVLRDVFAHGQPPCEQLLAPDAAASTATRPNVRDDGQRPSSRDGMAGFVRVIWGRREADYFCNRDWTGQISLKLLEKIAPARTSILFAMQDTNDGCHVAGAVDPHPEARASCVSKDEGRAAPTRNCPHST